MRIACGVALLASLFLATPRAARAADVSVDQRLPKDTYVFFSVPRIDQTKKRFTTTSFGKLIRDKAFDEFRKDIEILIKKGSAAIEKQTGLKLDDILAIPSGELAVAVVKSSRKVPTFIVSMNFGKHEASVEKLLKLAEGAAKAQGAKRATMMHKGTEIVVYTPPGEAEVKVEPSYLIKDSTLVFSTEAAALKGVLDRWDGKHESTFAKSEVYSYIKKRTKPGKRDAALVWYIDPLGLATAVINANEEIPGNVKMGFGLLSTLGITNFKAIGGSSDMSVGDYDSLSKSVIYVKQPATGVLDLFRFPAAQQIPPAWVSANVESYMAANWDLNKAYGAAAALYGMISLGGPEALDKLIDQLAKGGPKVHIKKDVLNQLTGRIYMVTDSSDGAALGTPRMTGAFGVKDAAKMQALLDKLTKLPEFPGKERKVNGKTLYEVDLGALGAGDQVLGFGVVGKHLFVTSEISVLENIAKGKGAKNKLADSKEFKALMARMPAKSSMITFQSGGASQLKQAWDMLRAGAVPVGDDFPVDFTKLPPYSAIKKYMHASASFTIPDKNGAYMESLQLKTSK